MFCSGGAGYLFLLMTCWHQSSLAQHEVVFECVMLVQERHLKKPKEGARDWGESQQDWQVDPWCYWKGGREWDASSAAHEPSCCTRLPSSSVEPGRVSFLQLPAAAQRQAKLTDAFGGKKDSVEYKV